MKVIPHSDYILRSQELSLALERAKYAWRTFNESVTSPVQLVKQLEQAESDKSYHYADCSDQEEKYDCQECRRVTEDVYQAKKQLEACPEAKAIYDLPESLARRRQASREYLRYVEVRYPEEDY